MIEGQGSIEVGRWSEFYIFIAFKIRIISNLIKELIYLFLISEKPEIGVKAPQFDHQYWLGARDFGHHSEHVPGTWVWEHRYVQATVMNP